MPIVLIIAFAASLGMHALLLFGPDFDLSTASEPLPPLLAELQPPPPRERPPQAPLAAPLHSPPKPVAKAARIRSKKRQPQPAASPRPVLSVADSPTLVPAALPAPAPVGEPTLPEQAATGESAAEQLPAPAPPAAALLMPARGKISYRVDRGEQGFEIGRATHDWEIADGAYRITAVTETSGLVALFKPLRIELESRGRVTPAGLVPERFVTRRKGVETGEHADFDWQQMLLRVGNRPAQPLLPGTQDLLSFHYQLALRPDLVSGSVLPVATGKKYGQYRIEVVGDEDLETPAGNFRALHLRAPGVSTTELWLAYDRSLLPVKIQYVDRDGAVYVQTATAIELHQNPNQEP